MTTHKSDGGAPRLDLLTGGRLSTGVGSTEERGQSPWTAREPTSENPMPGPSLTSTTDRQAHLWQQVAPATSPLPVMTSRRVVEVISLLLAQRYLPPPLDRSRHGVSPEQAIRLVEEDGIAIWETPSPEIITELVAAPDHAARRGILTSRWESIAQHCAGLVDDLDDEISQRYSPFVRDGIGALRAGCPLSAQAMFSAVGDRLVVEILGSAHGGWEQRASHGGLVPFELTDLTVPQWWLVVQTWHVYKRSEASGGEGVSGDRMSGARLYAVRPESYDLASCILALLFATSLLLWTERHGAEARQPHGHGRH